MISTAIQQLVNYGLDTGLILPDDEIYIRNQLLMTMQLDDFTAPEGEVCYTDLESILKTLVDDAVARGVCEDNSTARDLFDTKLMGVLTPRPSIVRANFEERYESEGPQAATDWFYKFSQDTDYIRRYRIKRDLKWVTKTPYGDLDITINLSKPEKDPKAIAAAKLAPQSAYPKCQLCAENEGYAGRMNHPARENHRIIPLTINDSAWNLHMVGGLSGPAIRPLSVFQTWRVAQEVAVDVVGCGGIVCAADVKEYMAAGAKAVEIGTANFTEPETIIRITEAL